MNNSQKIKSGDLKKSPLQKKLTAINCSKFFPTYCPTIKDWKSKLRGYSSHKMPIDFTIDDSKIIIAGMKRMTTEIFILLVEN